MNIPRIPLYQVPVDYMSISSSDPNMSISPNTPTYLAPVLTTTIPNTVTVNSLGVYPTLPLLPTSPEYPTLPYSPNTLRTTPVNSLKVYSTLNNLSRGLEKYTLLEKIGSGGQGSVYKAVNKTNGKIVALKILNIDSRNINEASQELSALEKISTPNCHPFLTCYYDHYYDSINRQLFIEMEYIEGLVLSSWSRQFTGQELHNKLLLVIDDLCKALSFIHSQGIIHRDVKPENIIVTNDNIPKLIDFGISCLSMLCYANLPCCRQDPGTLPYMAPETYSLRESYYASDIWSLGVTIFVVATGLYPFNFSRAQTMAEYRTVVLNNRPLALTTPNEKLNSIVNSCLNPNPLTRITIPQIQAIIRS